MMENIKVKDIIKKIDIKNGELQKQINSVIAGDKKEDLKRQVISDLFHLQIGMNDVRSMILNLAKGVK